MKLLARLGTAGFLLSVSYGAACAQQVPQRWTVQKANERFRRKSQCTAGHYILGGICS